MNCAVDYAPVGDSEVFAWQGEEEPRHIKLTSGKGAKSAGIFSSSVKRPKKSKISESMSATDFLNQLQPNDLVYTALGGQNDRFCMVAFRRETKLLRLPTWIIHDEQKRQRQEEGKVGEQVETAVSILYRTAVSRADQFYPFRDVEDERYLRIRLLIRMFYTVQRKIRIATANRLRHLQQDLEFFGGLKGLPVIQQSIDSVLETIPAEEQVEVEIDPKGGVAVKFFKTLEGRFMSAIQAELNDLPLYQAVFKNLEGCGPGIPGYVIASIMDIRRFPTLPKLRAFAGYHLVSANGNGQMKAPRMEKGQRANWDHKLRQAVWFFTYQVNKLEPDNPWKIQLETRYRRETEKLLQIKKDEGKIPPDFTVDQFFSTIEVIREEQRQQGIKEPKLPEPYKGIPALSRKRAQRWIGQKFLQYVWTEWRRFEGLESAPISTTTGA